MRVTQTLASGEAIRQDFRTAGRFVFFDTGLEQWQYATHGGTMFLVFYNDKPYGLTCRHVLNDFGLHQLVVTDRRQEGSQIAGLQSVAYPSKPKDAAIDTDVLDVAVIQFSDDVGAEFFKDPAYILDKNTMTTSNIGDTLHVAGTLKDKSEITERTIAPVFCILEMVDQKPASNDPTLRRAIGKFDSSSEIADVTGLSGSPVFNVTQNALCGMVVRGTINADLCTLWYVDLFDIVQLLNAVHEGRAETYYRKEVVPLRDTAG